MAFDAMFKPFAAKPAREPNRTERRAALRANRPQRPAPYRWGPGQAERITAWTAATLRMRGSTSSTPPPDPGDDLTSGPGTSVGTDYQFAPVLRDREIYRTTLVSQGDDFIDLQTEVAIPVSPTATGWTVSGTDVAYFEISNGQIYLKAATRASISKPASLALTVTATNSYGTSTTVALTVKIPADTDCRFCSYVSGSDSNNGTTPALAWKHVPGSTSYTGSAVTLGAGKVLFFKAEAHRYGMYASSFVTLGHGGSSGNPMVYAFSGWAGRAIVSGDDAITGWTDVASSGAVFGNANWASLDQIDMTAGSNGGALAYYQHVFFGDVMGFPAQLPRPTILSNFEDPTVDVTGGMFRAQNTTSSGVSPRISQSGSTVTIVDPRIAAKFGANDPTGWPINVHGPGNEVSRQTVASYNQGTSTVTITMPGSDTINTGSGYGAYSFTHHPCLIEVESQFAFSSTAGTTVIAWRPNADTTSAARRQRGISHAGSHTIIEGGEWRRFVSDSGGNGGFAWGVGSSSADVTNLTLRDMRIRQCRADGGNGLIYASHSGDFIGLIVERIAMLESNPRASGIRFGSELFGYTNGTPAQVRANARGKIRWNYCAPAAIQRTFFLSSKGNGMHIYENCARGLRTVHGNCVSLYSDGGSDFNGYNVVELNFFDNCVRGYTTSSGNTTPRYNLVTRNIFLGNTDGFVVAMFSGDASSEFSENIVMGASGWDYTQALFISYGYGITVRNNVAAGITANTPLSSCSYTVIDNLITANAGTPTNDGPTRVVANNDNATGYPFEVWNGTLTSEMQATLGPGQLGIFHAIAA